MYFKEQCKCISYKCILKSDTPLAPKNFKKRDNTLSKERWGESAGDMMIYKKQYNVTARQYPERRKTAREGKQTLETVHSEAVALDSNVIFFGLIFILVFNVIYYSLDKGWLCRLWPLVWN